MRSNLRNREKMPMTVEESDRRERRRMHQQHLENERAKKIRQDEKDLEMKQHYRELYAYNYVKRMRNLEQKKGKDWVPTKAEYHDHDGIPHKIFESYAEEDSFIRDLYSSRGCTEDEMEVERIRLRSEYEAKLNEHHELLWWEWFAFRDAQRKGEYNNEQASYAKMLQKIEEEDREEESRGLSFFEYDIKQLAQKYD